MLNAGSFVCVFLLICSSWAATVLQPQTAVSQRCRNLAAWGQCEFYTCMEERFPCGADGFILKYGKYFCDKVNSEFHNLNVQGQRFMNLTSICLTSNLLNEYLKDSTTCGAIQNAGVANIISCQSMRHNGTTFCDFARGNSDVYMQMFTPADASRMLLLDYRLTYEFFVRAVTCGGKTVSEAISRIGSHISQTVATFLRWMF